MRPRDRQVPDGRDQPAALKLPTADHPRRRGTLPQPNRLASVRAGSDMMIRKLKSGGYRLYSRKINPKTGKRRNLGTFATRAAAEKHEREVQYFKRH